MSQTTNRIQVILGNASIKPAQKQIPRRGIKGTKGQRNGRLIPGWVSRSTTMPRRQ